MRLKLYCNRYGHFKDALVCSVNCVYRTRCQDFALFYDEHREGIDALVGDYFAARRESGEKSTPLPVVPRRFSAAPDAGVMTPTGMRALIRLEVKQEMAEATYIWIDKEDRAELISTEEVLRRAERGAKAKNIYKVAQEMELRFQLVPRKRIEKAKRIVAAETERANARRARVTKTPALSLASAPPTSASLDESADSAPAPRRARARAKAAGER